MASRREHWNRIYRVKGEDELSWHQDTPRLSLRLIRTVAGPESRVLDVGGGSSLLTRRLARGGYRHLAVLDISDVAVRSAKTRSGDLAHRARWVRADVTKARSVGRADVWHDRAVFHFLTRRKDRLAYVRLARRTVPVGGHLVLATFALDGPEQCSGLDVVRYDGPKLAAEFAPAFALSRVVREIHRTPWGTRQPFTYAVLRRVRVVPGRRGAPTATREGVAPRRKRARQLP